MLIRDKLRALRMEHGMTQKELAEIAGTTAAAVSAWETGIRSPKIQPLRMICEHFGLNVSEFVDEDVEGVSDQRSAAEEDEKIWSLAKEFLKTLPPKHLRGVLLALDAPQELIDELEKMEQVK